MIKEMISSIVNYIPDQIVYYVNKNDNDDGLELNIYQGEDKIYEYSFKEGDTGSVKRLLKDLIKSLSI